MAGDILAKASFFEYGKQASTSSGFRGVVTHDTLFNGLSEYTKREKAVQDSITKEFKEENTLGSYSEYTSRQKAIESSMHNGLYFTMTESGRLYTDADRDKWKINAINAFSKDGDIAWSLVISLRNYDLLKKYMLIDQNQFSIITQTALARIFPRLGFDPDNMIWWEDYHTNTKHPHLHIMFMEKEHKRDRGKLTKNELNLVKREFFTEIAARKTFFDLHSISSTDALKTITPMRKEVVDSITFDDLPYNTVKMIAELFSELPGNGRLQYGSKNMEPYRERLDKIVDDILKCDDIAPLYSEYMNTSNNLQSNLNDLANDEISNFAKVQDDKLRKQIANMILKSFKDNRSDYIERCKLKPWSTDKAIQLASIISEDVINDKSASDAEKIAASFIKNKDYVSAMTILKEMNDSDVKAILNAVVHIANDDSSDNVIKYKNKITELSKTNKYAKRYSTLSRNSKIYNVRNYTLLKRTVIRNIKSETKRALRQQKKEIQDEINSYLRNDKDIPSINYQEHVVANAAKQ